VEPTSTSSEFRGLTTRWWSFSGKEQSKCQSEQSPTFLRPRSVIVTYWTI
jgi:hypothetical protein